MPDVHLLGHVSNEELTALYDVADVFLSASEHEGFCVPLVEAFHKGTPVMRSRRPRSLTPWMTTEYCTNARIPDMSPR